MKKLSIYYFVFVTTLCLSNFPIALPDRRVGNGSDSVELAFSAGANEAAYRVGLLSQSKQMINRLEASHGDVKGLFDPTIIAELSVAIKSAPLHFIETNDEKSYSENKDRSCAWTNLPVPLEPNLDFIRIYKDICAPFVKKDDGFTFVLQTLVHEALHHILRKHPEFKPNEYAVEENLVNRISVAMVDVFAELAEPGQDHLQDLLRSAQNPSPRAHHGTIWTGETGDPKTSQRMIIWGGCRESDLSLYGCGSYFSDGAIYDAKAQSWSSLPQIAVGLKARAFHSMIWTGNSGPLKNKILIWGGCTGGTACETYLNDGVIFDPFTGETQLLPSAAAPSGRLGHSTLWTGESLLIWGGEMGRNATNTISQSLADGAEFDGTKWKPISTPQTNVLSPRKNHSAVWTGDTSQPKTTRKMIIWGGCVEEHTYYCTPELNDGAVYDPLLNTWESLPSSNGFLVGRHQHFATWALNKMIIWGGKNSNSGLNDGAVFDLETAKWTSLPSNGSSARYDFLGAWTGHQILVMGGESSSNTFASQIEYMQTAVGSLPFSKGRWQEANAKFSAIGATGVWTGYSMIVWGGQTGPQTFSDAGFEYTPPFR